MKRELTERMEHEQRQEVTVLKPDFDVVSRRLIKKLGAIETRYAQVRIEYKRRRGKRRELLGSERRELQKQWRNVKRSLHGHFRPVILERDGYKCRVCGQSRNLEMARLFEDSLYVSETKRRSPEVRYSERNMLTLCEEYHRRFDSFHGRICRFKRGISTVEEAVQFLQEGSEALSYKRRVLYSSS